MALIWKTKPVLEGESERQLAEYFKALGHPIRLRIFRRLLQEGATSCGDLVAGLPAAQSTVSQHLKILREAGLIAVVVEGPRRRYHAEERSVRRFQQVLTPPPESINRLS